MTTTAREAGRVAVGADGWVAVLVRVLVCVAVAAAVEVLVLVAVAGCAWTASHFYRTTGQSVDRAWWPVLATLASLLVVSGVLLAGTMVRNLLLFRGRRRRR